MMGLMCHNLFCKRAAARLDERDAKRKNASKVKGAKHFNDNDSITSEDLAKRGYVKQGSMKIDPRYMADLELGEITHDKDPRWTSTRGSIVMGTIAEKEAVVTQAAPTLTRSTVGEPEAEAPVEKSNGAATPDGEEAPNARISKKKRITKNGKKGGRKNSKNLEIPGNINGDLTSSNDASTWQTVSDRERSPSPFPELPKNHNP